MSKTISLVGQNVPIVFDFTVENIVGMGRYPYGNRTFSAHDKEIIDWALSAVDALHLRSRPVSQLSTGERQRIYIARALVTESPILLLDEPTSSLDIRHQIEIWNLMKSLLQKGKVIIVTSHDLIATARYCDHVAIMHKGRAVSTGPFSEVVNKDLLQQVFGVLPATEASGMHFDLAPPA